MRLLNVKPAILAASLACLALPLFAQGQDAPGDWRREWPGTDFTRSAVSFDEILSGGPPKDGIPAINDPTFHPAAQEGDLHPREPVVALSLPETGEPARAYPVRYLMWHEIVNDDIGDVPVAATYCPLCNTSVVFDRRLNGEIYTFGVSGKLRHSDMIMYDRQTESWWQQFTGEAIVGAMTGARLTMIPSLLQSWSAFLKAHPDGLVMKRPAGYSRSYGSNPYVGYDGAGWPFLYRGDPPPHDIAPMARVVRVGDRAWPLSRLSAAQELIEDGVRLTWAAGQASALDSRSISKGREVGDIAVYDAETGALVVFEVTFAFAFHAFHPDGRWMLGG